MNNIVPRFIAIQRKRTVIAGLFILTAGCLSFLICQKPVIPFAIFGAVIFFVLIFKRPSLALALSLFIMQDFFSLLSTDTFRLPGMFKLRDLVLVALFVPLAEGLFLRRRRSAHLFSLPVAKAILLFLSSVVFIAFYTKFYYGAPWDLIIRSGRHLLYYTMFFVTVYCLGTEQELNRFLKVLFWIMFGFSVLYIVQFLIGTGIHLFPHAVRIVEQKISSISVTRSYVIGKRIPALLICSLIGVFLFEKKLNKASLVFTIGMAIFILETILTWGRAHWMATIIGIGIAFVLFAQTHWKKFFKIIIALFVIALILSFFVGFSNVGPSDSPLQLAFARLHSTYNDFIMKTGTYGYRLTLAKEYLSGVISKHILFGVGYIHPEISEIVRHLPGSTVTNSDLGNFNILIQMGLLGFFSLIVLLIVFFKRAVFIFNTTDNGIHKGIVWGILAFYIGRLFAWSLGTFVSLVDLVPFAMSMGIIEAVYQIEQRKASTALNCEE